MKRALVLQDMSCLGRCSMSTAISVLSASGIECAALPVSLLSSHTGFGEPEGLAALAFCERAARRWKALDITFDALHIGYLGSRQALEFAEKLAGEFPDRELFLFDPAFGDGGKLYRNIGGDYPAAAARLCAKADVIVPNVTEAAMLLGDEPRGGCDGAYIEDMLARLAKLGASSVVITGVSLQEGTVGAAALKKGGTPYFTANEKGRDAFGTGDLFASVLTASLLRGGALYESVKRACDFVSGCVAAMPKERDERFGVPFEDRLGELAGH